MPTRRVLRQNRVIQQMQGRNHRTIFVTFLILTRVATLCFRWLLHTEDQLIDLWTGE